MQSVWLKEVFRGRGLLSRVTYHVWTKWLGVGGFVVGVKVTYQMWTKLEEAFAVRVRVTYHMRTKWWGLRSN